jgi:hypothetical protein
MVDILRKELDMSFEDAVKKVEDVSEDEGFTILLTKGMHDMFKKKLGIENYPRTTFILTHVCGYASKEGNGHLDKDGPCNALQFCCI